MRGKQNNTSQLVLGAIMLAVFVVLYMVVPIGDKLIQSVLMVFTFIPITIYVVNCGRGYSAIMVLAGCILSALFLQPLVLIAYAIPSLIIGVVAGLTITKSSKKVSILIFTLLHLLQNTFEIIFYYRMMNIDFFDMYGQSIKDSMNMISEVVTSKDILVFVEDLMICSIPTTMIVGAIVKGVLSFWITSIVINKLSTLFGGAKINRKSQIVTMKTKTISIIYIVVLAFFTIFISLVLSKTLPYHFIVAVGSMIMIICMAAYAYYFYLVRIRNTETSLLRKVLYATGIVLFLPISVYLMPIIDLTKRATKNQRGNAVDN